MNWIVKKIKIERYLLVVVYLGFFFIYIVCYFLGRDGKGIYIIFIKGKYKNIMYILFLNLGGVF